MKNGYVFFQAESLALFKSRGWNGQNVGDIKVGLQTDVQVTSGEKRNGMVELCTDDRQIVNQVFTAAANMGGFPGLSDDLEVEKFARFILHGAYRGTILAATANANRQANNADLPGKDKVFLTMIGGGVFGNKLHWITDAIMECKELMKNSGLQIYLVCYSPYSLDESSLTRLQMLASEMGGEILQVN